MKKLCSLWAVGVMFATRVVAAASFLDGAQWASSNGPPGGVVNVLAAQGSSLYAGSNQGLYKSTDGGAQWRITSFPLGSSVLSLAFTDGVILAGTAGEGIFRSVDEGDSWISANQGLDAARLSFGLSVNSLTVSSVGVLAIVNGSLYVSVDLGMSWILRGTSLAPFNSLLAVGNTLYGAACSIIANIPSGGVYKSDNGGATWALTSKALSNRCVLVVQFSNGGLYAGTDNGIYRSSDQGANWTPSGLTGKQVTAFISDGSSLYAGSYLYGVFKSVDRAVAWSRTGHPGVDVLSLASLGSTVFSGTRFGVYGSDNGGSSWAAHNGGLTNTYVGGVWTAGSDVFAQDTIGEIGFGQGELYRSSDSGTSWTTSSNGLPLDSSVDSLVSDGGALYVGVFGGGVYKSTNRGDTWFPVGPGLPVVPGQFYTLIARSGLVLVAIGNQVFRSTDAGTTWSGPSAGLLTNELITNMVLAGDAVYAGTISGMVKSLDGGISWQAAGLGVFIRLVAASGETVYAITTGSGVLKMTDGGNSWTPTGLARNDIYSFATSGGSLFAANFGNANGAGQESHVFLSNDDGQSWSTVDQGLFLSGGLGGVYLAASDRILYAGTQGNGVQTLKLLPDREFVQPPTRVHRTRVVEVSRPPAER